MTEVEALAQAVGDAVGATVEVTDLRYGRWRLTFSRVLTFDEVRRLHERLVSPEYQKGPPL
jgi:hypothetical protein